MQSTRITVALVAALAVTACKTDLTGLNVNPNSPSVDTPPPAGTIFTRAVATTGGRVGGSGYQLSMMELLAQHIAQYQYVDEDRFAYRVGTIDGYFTGPYVDDLMNYQQVINVGQTQKDGNTYGPAMVMMQFAYQNMTDTWGDIPYSQALQGLTGPLKPQYDAQKDIYYGMVKALTDANTAMGGAGPGLGSGDQIYAGDASKWKKFANSLRLRLAMRMQKADLAKANTELTAALAAGPMASNSDNAQITWPGDQVFDNPWASNFAGRDDHRMSKTLMDVLIANNDPRLTIYAQPTKADPTKYAGEPNGLDNASANQYGTTASRPGLAFYPGSTTYGGTIGTSAGRKTPTYLMTYAEVCFIKAEAANRGMGGLTAAQAQGFYEAGITASITQWGGTAAQAAAYIAQPSVAYQGGAAGLTQILTQKWISFFTQGQEAWSDWRRTGIPANITPGPKATLTYMPRRMLYATTEQSVNNDALQAAITRQGADTYATRMWWDK